MEPHLEQAAARIATVVEAERPTTHSTLKGLIHEDVNKTTEELYSRIQSLEAKLGKTKNALKRKAVSSGDAATYRKKMAKTWWATARSQTRHWGMPSPIPLRSPANTSTKTTRGRRSQQSQKLHPQRNPLLPPLATTMPPPLPTKNQG